VRAAISTGVDMARAYARSPGEVGVQASMTAANGSMNDDQRGECMVSLLPAPVAADVPAARSRWSRDGAPAARLVSALAV
jgi:hypothetical protein